MGVEAPQRGMPGGFTLSFKEGVKHGSDAIQRTGRQQEAFLSQHCLDGFVTGIYYHLRLRG